MVRDNLETLFGAVDDLWQARSGELMVVDYKATSRGEMPTTSTLYPSYRRQMDVYQYLVRQQGFEVSDRGWFVYTNGDGRAADFGDKLCFRTALVPYDGDDAWVLDESVIRDHAVEAGLGVNFDGTVPGDLPPG